MPYHLTFENHQIFKDYFFEEHRESIRLLPKANYINIFIGANNSGKSRFIRNLLSIREFYPLDYDKHKQYFALTSRTHRLKSSLINSESPIKSLLSDVEWNDSILSESNYSRVKEQFDKIGFTFKAVLNNAYYIPTLRTAHTIYENEDSKVEKDLYTETIQRNYKLNRKGIQIFTGQQLYKNILNSRNSKKEIRKRFEEFEKFLSKNFFDGKEVDVVAEFNKDHNLSGKNSDEIISVHVEGDKDRYLYELGDGIQAIIILMYQIFMAEPHSFIYIDEPELHLHPGMQRLFLEQLCTNEDLKKKNLTYFITTHSNHFLDLTIEKDNVSIYSFSPREGENGEKQFVIKNVNAGDNDILKHLGVNNSSVFMANCSIWVEGISDRNYVKAFLYAYLESIKGTDDYKSIKEDIDYAFFEYAGSNIDHYFFGDLEDVEEEEVVKDINALALHNRIFLLADSDCADDGSAKKQRLEKLKNAQRPNFVPKIIEGVREIENLLMNSVWQEVLIEFCNKNLVNSKREEVNTKIGEALKTYKAEDFHSQYIGTFLSKLRTKMGDINGDKILNESCYVTKPKLGTFVYKRELSELVLKKVNSEEITWADFKENPHIETLTKEIYNFILQSKN